MPEVGEMPISIVPNPVGLDNSEKSPLIGILDRLPSHQVLEAPKNALAKLQETRYKDVINPDYQHTHITEQAERNRQILLWAINKGVPIPATMCSMKVYGETPTAEMIENLFNAKQLQDLQAWLLTPLALHQDDVDPKNLLVIGGISYSQSKITGKEDGLLRGVLKKETAHAGFREHGRRPGMFRKNVKGALHIYPYAVGEPVPGKEKEAALMIADDLLSLITYMETNPKMGFPRFINNVTNPEVAQLAAKYLKAQVRDLEFSSFQFNALMSTLTMGQAKPRQLKQVFLTGEDLKSSRDQLTKVKDVILRVRGGKSEEEQLKEVRMDAIKYIMEMMNFVELLDKKKTPDTQTEDDDLTNIDNWRL